MEDLFASKRMREVLLRLFGLWVMHHFKFQILDLDEEENEEQKETDVP
jgi:hypothetical protein